MTSARAWTTTLRGVDSIVTEVTALTDPAQPRPVPRSGMAESLDRVHAAIRNSDLPRPGGPVAVALSPEAGSRSLPAADLAIACAVLATSSPQVSARLDRTLLLGELGLDGSIRPVAAVLPALLAAQRAGLTHAIVPIAAAPETAHVSGITVLGADRLADVAAWLHGDDTRLTSPTPPHLTPAQQGRGMGDLADVHGQPEAAEALQIAAAGGHSILMIGKAGTGITMLARRLPGLLPVLTPQAALDARIMLSIMGRLPHLDATDTQRPFVAPHHTTSMAALIGSRRRPGAVTLAHRGVLFLDHAPEFGHDRLDALCPILDRGEVRFPSSQGVVQYPAQFQLVLAARDCPCHVIREHACQCSSHAKRRYLRRLSPRLLERVDLAVRTRPVGTEAASTRPPAESTALVRERVARARERAAHRWASYGVKANAAAPDNALRDFALPRRVFGLLERAVDVGLLTPIAANRALRLAWTLADLAGLDRPGRAELATAIRYRHLQT